MSDVLDSAFDVNRPRSEGEWRGLLTALAEPLSRLLQRELVVTVRAEDDEPDARCWGATAHFRVVLSPVPRLEVTGIIAVTVNVREHASISADLLLFAEGVRIQGPAGKEIFHLEFTQAERAWVARGWASDEHGEWESEDSLTRPLDDQD